jgi:hypothetical protein
MQLIHTKGIYYSVSLEKWPNESAKIFVALMLLVMLKLSFENIKL